MPDLDSSIPQGTPDYIDQVIQGAAAEFEQFERELNAIPVSHRRSRRAAQPANRYLKQVLQYVIDKNGLAPENLLFNQREAEQWESAKRKGLLRQVTASELRAHLENRRAVRAVLLAMCETAAADERTNPYETETISLDGTVVSLMGVANQIFEASRQTFWTLTDAGASVLETGFCTRRSRRSS